ncbi:MAG: YcgN family cysteine cluster protein [Pseudomonadota bacterium]
MARDPLEIRERFWERVALPDMTHAEWEALCDGCGKCCVLKLEDEDTGAVHYTDVACRLFDPASCRCGHYPLRKQLVPSCVVIDPDNIWQVKDWMPLTCAYRLLAEQAPLPDWHPLVSGRQGSVAEAGHSMSGRTVPEYEVDEDDLEDHVVPME